MYVTICILNIFAEDDIVHIHRRSKKMMRYKCCRELTRLHVSSAFSLASTVDYYKAELTALKMSKYLLTGGGRGEYLRQLNDQKFDTCNLGELMKQ